MPSLVRGFEVELVQYLSLENSKPVNLISRSRTERKLN